MAVLNNKTVGAEILQRASTIISPELLGDPNLLTDARIVNAREGDWFIPFDVQSSRWQKISVIDNEWVEFNAGLEPDFTVAVDEDDGNPAFLEEKIGGTHGTQAANFNQNEMVIDVRRTAFFYGM